MKKKYKKKVLLIGSKEYFSLEKMYLRAFKKAHCDVNIFHIHNINKNLISRLIWKYLKFFFFFDERFRLLKYLKKHQNKYDLIIIYKGLYLTDNFLIRLKKISPVSKFINIFPDDPFDVRYFKDISNKNILNAIKYFDYFFIFSKKIKKKLELFTLKKNIIYLPFAYDPDVHKRSKKSYNDMYDLSFIGTADDDRYNFIKELNSYKILVAGNGWSRYKKIKNVTYYGAINGKLSSEIIKKSIISLNLLRKQNYYSHNMRTFEIPAMGGLMLTKKSVEQSFFFKEGQECLMYENFNDIDNKIKMVLENKKKFKKIANAGHMVSRKHTYLSRVNSILKIVSG